MSENSPLNLKMQQSTWVWAVKKLNSQVQNQKFNFIINQMAQNRDMNDEKTGQFDSINPVFV